MYDPTKPYKHRILELIRSTWNTPYLSVTEGVYPAFTKHITHPEIDHTDEIGTKGLYHWQQRTFRSAVIDALAMNLNDLLLARARPYKLQNNIFLPRDDHEAILEIIEALADECKKRDIAITGGETSIHDTLEGLEISITISGFIEHPAPNRFKIGDLLIGLPSSGLHSNGFTKVREIFGPLRRSSSEASPKHRPEFVEPTTIYWDRVYPALKHYDIHGMMHITGGAYTKLKDILPADADVIVHADHTLAPHSIFRELYARDISDIDMYRTFNCGIGFILSAAPEETKQLAEELGGDIIGEIVSGNGNVKITSAFDGIMVALS